MSNEAFESVVWPAKVTVLGRIETAEGLKSRMYVDIYFREAHMFLNWLRRLVDDPRYWKKAGLGVRPRENGYVIFEQKGPPIQIQIADIL